MSCYVMCRVVSQVVSSSFLINTFLLFFIAESDKRDESTRNGCGFKPRVCSDNERFVKCHKSTGTQ